jgi:predicted MPP superfamily phosphohydrolase
VLLPRGALLALAHLTAHIPAFQPQLGVTLLKFQIHCLPAVLESFCIAQVSDFHVGEGSWMPFKVKEAAEAVRAAQPDVVVNNGDYLQWEPPMEKVIKTAEPFVVPGATNLSILGNHDYDNDPPTIDALTRGLASLGIRVMANESMRIGRGGSDITFVALTDDAPGFDAAVADLLAAPRPRVVLLHEPDLAERLPETAADLILAGHTHGAQIHVPFLKQITVRYFSLSRFEDGLHNVKGTPVYVNRGLGCTGLPVRFRSTPEVTLIHLVH